MKTLLLLASLFLFTSAASAQIDPAVQAAVQAAVPTQYAGYTSLAILGLMMLGRCIKALQNGTGIKGWFSAIWCGTNTPKILIAGLCLLTLPSCTALEDKAGMSGIDLLMITANAANRVKTDYDATRADVTAAKLRYAARRPVTSAKEPADVTP